MMAGEINGVVGHYPTDPSNFVVELETFLAQPQKDFKLLAHSLYGIAGFVLNVVFGEPGATAMAKPDVLTAVGNLISSLEGGKLVIPDYLKPILSQILAWALAWLQSKV